MLARFGRASVLEPYWRRRAAASISSRPEVPQPSLAQSSSSPLVQNGAGTSARIEVVANNSEGKACHKPTNRDGDRKHYEHRVIWMIIHNAAASCAPAVRPVHPDTPAYLS